MGTRADFYIGTGPTAEWIGSTSYDGDPRGLGLHPLKAKSEAEFRAAIEAILADPHLMVTRPSEGWPWPWETSHTTDWAYAWDPARGAVMSCGGRRWTTPEEHIANPDAPYQGDKCEPFPDMSSKRMDSRGVLAKSGLIFL